MKNKLMDIRDPVQQARRRLGLYHDCLEPIIDEVNELIQNPFYLRFADRKVRLCQGFFSFFSMDGEEVAATLLCSTSDCPVCECPKEELDRMDVVYPLRHAKEVRKAIDAAREKLLEEDGTIKSGCKSKVSYTISYNFIIFRYDIAYDIVLRYVKNGLVCPGRLPLLSDS